MMSVYACSNHIFYFIVAISGQPAGPAAEYSKSCEDMYDEIVELKKVLLCS